MSFDLVRFSPAVERGLSNIFNLEAGVLTMIRNGVQRYFQGSDAQQCLVEAQSAIQRISAIGDQLIQNDESKQRSAAALEQTQRKLENTHEIMEQLEAAKESQTREHEATVHQLTDELHRTQTQIAQSAIIPLMRNPLVSKGCRMAVRAGKYALVSTVPIVAFIQRNLFSSGKCVNAFRSLSRSVQCTATFMKPSVLVPVAIAFGIGYCCKKFIVAANSIEQQQAQADHLIARITETDRIYRETAEELSLNLATLREQNAEAIANIGRISEEQRTLEQQKAQLDDEISRIQNVAHTRVIESQVQLIQLADTMPPEQARPIGFQALNTILHTAVAECAGLASHQRLAIEGPAAMPPQIEAPHTDAV